MANSVRIQIAGDRRTYLASGKNSVHDVKVPKPMSLQAGAEAKGKKSYKIIPS